METPKDKEQTRLLSELTQGIEALTSSKAWSDYLAMQAKFPTYSASNVMLIAAQRPDATRVAGFRAWTRLGRHVNRGERAIWILAPMVSRSRTRADHDAEAERVVWGFKMVPVFDVAQTDGLPLPSVCSRLEGEEPFGYFAQLVGVAEQIGFEVERCALDNGVNGDCAFATRTIRVDDRNAPLQQVKTLAHELAHAMLHASSVDRALAELEAESAAFVVCQSLGIATGDYSFGYVASWAGGGSTAVSMIKSSCRRIQETASAILDMLEAAPRAQTSGVRP